MPWHIKRNPKTGRKLIGGGDAPLTNKERLARTHGRETKQRAEDIAVLDFETDPFDAKANLKVKPFLCVIHSRQFSTIVIWEEDHGVFIDKVLGAIRGLPRRFTIYAHNGGKFDFMFLIHKLRGEIMFKGRGIMSARIGEHELRDSFHIIPEALRGYKKDEFDYSTLTKAQRKRHRDDITRYCINDCIYLLDIVHSFIDRFGRKISIGQAAAQNVKLAGYSVGRLSADFDAFIRDFYFGGRVECLAGIGRFKPREGETLKLYDVNSMYPTAMAQFKHPIGTPNQFTIRQGKPGPFTFFIDLTCDNYGALVCRTEEGETSATRESGRFFTTIYEHDAALELGLIKNVVYNSIVDCSVSTDFSNFVHPLYAERIATKQKMADMRRAGMSESDDAFLDVKKDDMFMKFLLNNCYGKYAQNPRRFKEAYITKAYDERPDIEKDGFKCCNVKQPIKNGNAICHICSKQHPSFGALPIWRDKDLDYAIWEKPTKRLAFNNVATAASITGAARAILMRAIATAVNPIYCDTDSLICADLPGVTIDKTALGAWDIEDEYSEVLVAGKKLYACRTTSGKMKFRAKGSSGLDWKDYEDMLDGDTVETLNKGPTMTRQGAYFYMARNIRATGPKVGNERLINRGKAA